jgi:hypothetical protein
VAGSAFTTVTEVAGCETIGSSLENPTIKQGRDTSRTLESSLSCPQMTQISADELLIILTAV